MSMTDLTLPRIEAKELPLHASLSLAHLGLLQARGEEARMAPQPSTPVPLPEQELLPRREPCHLSNLVPSSEIESAAVIPLAA